MQSCFLVLLVFEKNQEHLLQMATEHRAEMAVKRGKAIREEEGL